MAIAIVVFFGLFQAVVDEIGRSSAGVSQPPPVVPATETTQPRPSTESLAAIGDMVRLAHPSQTWVQIFNEFGSGPYTSALNGTLCKVTSIGVGTVNDANADIYRIDCGERGAHGWIEARYAKSE